MVRSESAPAPAVARKSRSLTALVTSLVLGLGCLGFAPGASTTAQAAAGDMVWVPQADDTGTLAFTGAEVGAAISWALLFLIGGGALVALAGRNRRRGQRYL